MNKRDFLKTVTCGFAGVCAAGISGCKRKESAKKEGDNDVPVMKAAMTGGVQSSWFSSLEGDMLRCELCPEQCRLKPGFRAKCRVRENRNGKGYTVAYANPPLVQEDNIERNPFFHVLPGSRALSVSTAGCNLACSFCEVWDLAMAKPEEVHCYDMPPEAVVQQAKQAELPSISYAFGEPVIFYEYMYDIAVLAKKAGLMNLFHSAAYIQPEPLRKLLPLIDAANVDLKSFDPQFYRTIVKGELKPVLNAMEIMKKAGIHVEITNIVIPSLNDDLKKVEEMCRWIYNEMGADTPLHFARFYPLHRLSDLPQTPVSTLDRVREIALKTGLKYVYVARVTGHEGENTFCPSCGKKIIDRMGFVIDEINVEKGRCSFCSSAIPGVWG